MVMKIKVIFSLLTISLLLFLAACTPTIPEPAYAASIAEGLLTGLSDADYEVFSSNMSAEMTSKIDAESFLALYAQISSKIGAYSPGSIKFNRAMEEGEIVSVFYNASFTNESGAVSVNVVFGQEDGRPVVEGLWLNSPKLRQ
jgi:hypothetical protein